MTKKFSILNYKFSILLFIIVIASFLRFYQLSNVPPSASLDEASIGYNAYSILKTGADEYGIKFPILLRAYDDWRPALYVYFVIPFVKIFGLNVFAVRLPSVILSILTVIATYFLVKQLFPKAKQFSIFNFQFSIGEIAMFFLAISPWHIYISRLGHEANIGLAFFIFALTFFFFHKFYSSFIFFALSFASYQSEKIIIPIFLVILLFIFRKEVMKKKKEVAISFFMLCAIILPFLNATFSGNALIRLKATNAFDKNSLSYQIQINDYKKAVDNNNFLGKIIYNRRTFVPKIFFSNYIAHFNPNWLFLNKNNDKHKVPDIGLFYLFELPFILLGIFALFFKKLDKKIKFFIIFWLLISPFPASITNDAPHAMRSYTFLPSWQILEGLGFVLIVGLIKKRAKLLFLTIFALVFLFSLKSFYSNYYIVFPKTQSNSFQFALSKAIPYILKNQVKYNRIVFSNQEDLYQSYMFFLFYSRYDPYLYQKQGGTKSGGFAETHSFGKYRFEPIEFAKIKKDNVLYIGNIKDFPGNIKELETFNYLDGKPAIVIVNQ